MHITINDKTSLLDIQKVFSDYYPYLKMEFYRKPHKKYEESYETGQIDPRVLVEDIKRTHVSGVLEIQPLYKVSDVEKEMQRRFGLSVQIFRREKEGWRQTLGTDDFTLKELNELGRNSSDEYIIEDYEEGFENPDDPM